MLLVSEVIRDDADDVERTLARFGFGKHMADERTMVLGRGGR
jgi:hypothetical protein